MFWGQNPVKLHTSGIDLLAYLWKTYLVAPDQEFMDYIKFLHNEYKDTRANYTTDQLMILAKNKYMSHLLLGVWGNPSEEHAKIVALTAKIDVLKKELSNNKKNQDNKKRRKQIRQGI